jgi:hypothetical protein
MKQRVGYVLMSAVLLLGLFVPLPANAVEVFVGYADNLRPTPFFPTPFFGDPSVALFAGESPLTHQLDSGAVRIFNNTAIDFVVTSLDVHMRNGTGTDFNLWGGFLGAGFTLHPGQNAIFVQTSGENFDSSDTDTLLGNGQSPSNNCSNGALAATATCINNPPLVTLNGGVPLKDTGHVLDTGGFDLVSANPCPNTADSPGNCNESLAWRDIGTTGVGNPGGNVPEPATLLLLGSGLAGLFALRRRKQI